MTTSRTPRRLTHRRRPRWVGAHHRSAAEAQTRVGTPQSVPHAERLTALLAANRCIVAELSLAAVLKQVVEAACEIAGAQYAALGIIGGDGRLEEFVHVGMDEATVAAIGELPTGRGVLGALIDDGHPTRLRHITDDPRSSGFPDAHPPMTSFLGVPVRSRHEIYGNLYLTNRRDGHGFTAEDEAIILALAATAGIAIENARLYEESRLRQEWLRASIGISRDLLAYHDDDRDVLQRIADSVIRLAEADVVTLVLPAKDDPSLFEVAVASGNGQDALRGTRYPVDRTLAASAMKDGRGALIESTDDQTEFYVHLGLIVPVGPVMAFPLSGEHSPRGAIVVGRLRGRHPFEEADLGMAEAFATQAAIALELSEARMDQQRLSALEDRNRIARDLHDHVIQRLFATGLTVQSAAAVTTADPKLHARLNRTVNDIDETIRQIRTSIFELESGDDAETLRGVALSVVSQVTPLLRVRPDTQFSGPLDTLVDDAIIRQVEAVLREALTNVAKHAEATTVGVFAQARHDQLTVVVNDDGIGFSPTLSRRSGLANLDTRAHKHGGQLTVHNRQEGGTRLTWTIPLKI